MHYPRSFQSTILVGFIVAGVLIAALGAASITVLTTVIEEKDVLISEPIFDLTQARRLSEIAEHKVASGRAYLITQDEEYLRRKDELRTEFLKVLASIQTNNTAVVESIRNAEREHDTSMTDAFEMKQENASPREIARFFEDRVQPSRMRLREAINEFIRRKESLLAARLEESGRSDVRAQTYLRVAAGTSIGIAAFLFILIARTAKQFRRWDQERSRLLTEAQEAVQARDEFLSIASHELKTPLTSLQLRAQAAMRAKDPEHARAQFENVFHQISHLSRLIDELLDLTRIRAGKLVLNRMPTDLAALTRAVAERFPAPIELNLPVELIGSWDPIRIEQVVTNLVSNAIKYGQGKPIRVCVSRRGDRASVEVEDRGLGISIEEQARIFERFERASSAKGIRGLGLGLYITRQIVEAHGGVIRFKSECDRGSTFTVELPIHIENKGSQPAVTSNE